MHASKIAVLVLVLPWCGTIRAQHTITPTDAVYDTFGIKNSSLWAVVSVPTVREVNQDDAVQNHQKP
jgi:hypothetical protein